MRVWAACVEARRVDAAATLSSPSTPATTVAARRLVAARGPIAAVAPAALPVAEGWLRRARAGGDGARSHQWHALRPPRPLPRRVLRRAAARAAALPTRGAEEEVGAQGDGRDVVRAELLHGRREAEPELNRRLLRRQALQHHRRPGRRGLPVVGHLPPCARPGGATEGPAARHGLGERSSARAPAFIERCLLHRRSLV